MAQEFDVGGRLVTVNHHGSGNVNDTYLATFDGAEPVILVRLSDSEFRAFAGTCTHLDCIVEFHKEPGRIWCNCHNGEYDLNGRVASMIHLAVVPVLVSREGSRDDPRAWPMMVTSRSG